MTVRKSFVYVVRRDGLAVRLLVFDSHDELGFEVPKGAVEASETFEDAAAREVFEEAGIEGIRIVGELGRTTYGVELQAFLLAMAPEGLPETFEHVVTGTGVDRGFRYTFGWLPIDAELKGRLVQGCGAFVKALIETLGRIGRFH